MLHFHSILLVLHYQSVCYCVKHCLLLLCCFSLNFKSFKNFQPYCFLSCFCLLWLQHATEAPWWAHGFDLVLPGCPKKEWSSGLEVLTLMVPHSHVENSFPSECLDIENVAFKPTDVPRFCIGPSPKCYMFIPFLPGCMTRGQSSLEGQSQPLSDTLCWFYKL